MASLTRWTWVWASFGSWWWIGKPSMLQSMGSQIVRHDRVTELNWYMHIIIGATDLGHLLCGKYLLYTPKPYSIVKISTKSDPISIRKSLTLFLTRGDVLAHFLWGRNLTSEAGCVVMGCCLGDAMMQGTAPSSVFLITVLFPLLPLEVPQVWCALWESPRDAGGEVIKWKLPSLPYVSKFKTSPHKPTH